MQFRQKCFLEVLFTQIRASIYLIQRLYLLNLEPLFAWFTDSICSFCRLYGLHEAGNSSIPTIVAFQTSRKSCTEH